MVTRYDWWFSVVCTRSVQTCDSIGSNRLCVRSPTCAYARTLLCALKYLFSFARWLSRLVGFTLAVKLTGPRVLMQVGRVLMPRYRGLLEVSHLGSQVPHGVARDIRADEILGNDM